MKQLAQQYGFSVFPYTLDGQGDTALSGSITGATGRDADLLPEYSGVATPTTFLVNVNTLRHYRLQGATDAAGFMAQLMRLQMYGGRKINKQVVLLIAGISGIATGIIVSLNIHFIHQGLFYPASPVEIVVSLCLTFSVSAVLGAIVWMDFRCLKYISAAGLV